MGVQPGAEQLPQRRFLRRKTLLDCLPGKEAPRRRDLFLHAARDLSQERLYALPTTRAHPHNRHAQRP